MAKNNEIVDWEEVPVDDWAEVPLDEKNKDRLSTLEAALEGVGQGASFGFAEELTAPFAAGAAILSGDAPKEAGESEMDRLSRLMQSYRDIARERTKTAETESPGTFFTGALAGGFLLPGAAGARATSGFGKVLKGTATGAGFGFVGGAGTAEGGLEERVEGGLTGAKWGGILGGAIPLGIGTAKGASTLAEKGIKKSHKGAYVLMIHSRDFSIKIYNGICCSRRLLNKRFFLLNNN
jgi:hypothetical protein